MKKIKRIGVDLGKRLFHVTAMDAKGGIGRRWLPCAVLRSYAGEAAGGPRVGDGGVRRHPPLGPFGVAVGAQGAADESAVRVAVRQVEQERRQRRGRHRGGGGPADVVVDVKFIDGTDERKISRKAA